uniref:VOC domain-containing protein n=1 Tax=Octactis speculum TaxID=3111310 RepID=A0A7S2DGU3_9STRA
MVKIHAPGEVDTGGRMCVRGGPGIRYVEFSCADPSTAALFYEQQFRSAVFNAPRASHSDYSTPQQWAVNIGVGPVHFVFTQANDGGGSESGDEDAAARQVGVHACVYASNFAKLYDTLPTFTNPRFKHLDTCDTMQEAIDSRTLRFKTIGALDGSPPVLELEHEVRMLRHKSFMKNIKYDRS